jgi:hypothetical protein
MGEAKNELEGVRLVQSEGEHEGSQQSSMLELSSGEAGSEPVSLAYWLEGASDLSQISGYPVIKNLGHLNEFQPFATSSQGERVVLYTVFPALQALGRLIPCRDYFSVMSATNLRGEKCYNPVRLSMFVVPDERERQVRYGIIPPIRQPPEWVFSRLPKPA